MKETENICNMPELAKIEIHQSEETGKIYFEFISHNGKEYDGLWQESKEIAPAVVEEIFQILEENTDIFSKKEWENRLPKFDILL